VNRNLKNLCHLLAASCVSLLFDCTSVIGSVDTRAESTIDSPEAATPELATPEAATPEAATTETATPELATSELATPENDQAISDFFDKQSVSRTANSPKVSGTITEIKVVGNKRVSTKTILFEISCKKGDKYNDSTKNEVLKELNKTGLFSSIVVAINHGILTIKVSERPTIGKIAYDGMKPMMRDNLKGIVTLKTRQVFSEATIYETQQTIQEIYKSQGLFGAKITPKIVRHKDNNTVDVVFEVKEGGAAYVRKIFFIGNDSFERAELRDVLNLQEKKWFHVKIFGGTVNKVYDQEKFTEDQKRLTLFYLNRGYADFEIVSALAELDIANRAFHITYNLKEGEIYKIGDVSVDSKVGDINNSVFVKGLIVKTGITFSNQIIEIGCNFLKAIAKSKGYDFVSVEPVFIKNGKKKTIDVKFIIRETGKIFVGKIDIVGNKTTRDFVIRREVDVNEGDPFDHACLKGIEDRVRALGFFKTVKVDVSDGNIPNSANLVVSVDEQRSGEIFAKFGYSSLEKGSIGLHLYNPNFIGKGQAVGVDWVLEKREQTFEIDFDMPYFLSRRLYFNSSLFFSKSKKFAGVYRTQVGGMPGIRYQLKPMWYQSWSYKLHREELSIDVQKEKDVAQKTRQSRVFSKTQQEYLDWLKTDNGKEYRRFISSEDDIGVEWGSAIIHTTAYDCRNRRVLPSKGIRIAWVSKFSGLGGGIRHWINTLSGSVHYKVTKRATFTIRGSFSHAAGIFGKKLRVVDSLFLGGDSMRGFDFCGIAPVRTLPKSRIKQAWDSFVLAEKPFLSDSQKQFLASEKDAIAAYLINEDKALRNDVDKFSRWAVIWSRSLAERQVDAVKMIELHRIRGRKVGGTMAWSSSFELSFPMPMFPPEAEIFGTIFVDLGAVWRSRRGGDGENSEILHDAHEMRVSSGFCTAWNSPFGMFSIGYAWPLRKSEHDVTKKFMFGYGMKFS
jgi:outer membrane protein insertion porin family